MVTHVRICNVVGGYADKRIPYREEHFAHARAAEARGELLFGGAVGDPINSALLVFEVENSAVVEAFARNDPCVRTGLITQ